MSVSAPLMKRSLSLSLFRSLQKEGGGRRGLWVGDRQYIGLHRKPAVCFS